MSPTTSESNLRKIIEQLKMSPHPEGGYFVETWRARDICDVPGHGVRNLGTGIYFLMPHGQMSRFHRLRADELWHFYQGDPITVVTLSAEHGLQRNLVGPLGLDHALPQLIIPEGTWFGALHETPPTHGYTLVGCTVSPGFDFKDFELATREQLVAQFSGRDETVKKWIKQLT